MQSSIKKEKGLKLELEFTVPQGEVDSCFSRNYLTIQQTAKMPGFRRGKIPLQIIKQNYKEHVYKEVMEELLNIFYPKAILERKILPAGPPLLIGLDLQEGKACKFHLALEAHPEITVKGFKSLKVKPHNIVVKEERVAEALDNLKQSCVELEDVHNSEPVQKGDILTLNIEGFSQATKGKTKSYNNLFLEIGKDMLAPGFDDKLIGLRLNEEKEFDFLFSKNNLSYDLEGFHFQGKLKITGFKKRTFPELDDKFAKRFNFENLEQLKERVRNKLKKDLEREAKGKMEDDIVQQLIEKNPLELPEVLVKEYKQKFQAHAIKELESRNMPLSEQKIFLKNNASGIEKSVKKALHVNYLMEWLIDELKIEVAEEDIKKSLQKSFPEEKPENMVKRLRKNQRWSAFLFKLQKEKAIDYLIERSDKTTDKTTDETAGKAADKATDETAGKAADKATGKTTGLFRRFRKTLSFSDRREIT